MLKNYFKNIFFLLYTFMLKQYFVFYKIIRNSLELLTFDIFHNNQLKLIALLHIVNVKNVK